MTQKETQKETKKEGLELAQLFKSPKLFNEDVLDNMPKEKLEEVKNSQTFDSDIKDKFGRVYNVLDETKNKEIDTETLELVLSAQQLLEDIEDDG